MTADLVAAITELTTTLNTVISTEREQNREDERITQWGEKWFVYSEERGEVEYKSEEAAYEGARYWYVHSKRPAAVDVFKRETQLRLYERRFADRSQWLTEPAAQPEPPNGINSPL